MKNLHFPQIKSQQLAQRSFTTTFLAVVTSAFVLLRVAWLLNPSISISSHKFSTPFFKIEPSEQKRNNTLSNFNYSTMVSKTATRSFSNIAKAGGAPKKKKESAKSKQKQTKI